MIQYINISIEQAQKIIDSGSCTIFDIRDEHSYEKGRLPGAQRLNDQKISRMRKTEKRNLPVLIYCYHGNSSKDIAQLLCDFGFSNVYNLQGGYTAWEAVEKQSTANMRTISVLTPDVRAWLVEQGADPKNMNQRLDNGMTALMHACRFGLANTAKTLLHAGSDINLKNSDGNNALWFACFSGDATTIEALIGRGIDINNQNVSGATALMYAASAGKVAVVKQLLDAGADPFLVTQDDFTALDLAASAQTYKLLRSVSLSDSVNVNKGSAQCPYT